MLRFGLVLLVATSALAVPSIDGATDIVLDNQIWLDDVGTAKNVGINHLTDIILNLVDDGDATPNMLTVKAIINDLGAQKHRSSQVFALGHTLGIVMERSNGIPGDVCIIARLIDEWGKAVASGNFKGVRQPLLDFVVRFALGFDRIITLIKNPEEARYSKGPSTSCPGGGRSYAFELAWESILSSASPYNIGLLKEQYCATQRLYKAFDVRSNNVAAAITVRSLPPVRRILDYAFEPIIEYLKAIAYNGNLSSAAARAKRAVLKAAGEVNLKP